MAQSADCVSDRGSDYCRWLNVYAREVEEVLQAHPGVRMAAVVGEYDELRGEVVHAFIEPVPGHTLESKDLIRYCRERLADYKCPCRVTVLAELPRSTTGKILKRVLKEGFKGHPIGETTRNRNVFAIFRRFLVPFRSVRLKST